MALTRNEFSVLYELYKVQHEAQSASGAQSAAEAQPASEAPKTLSQRALSKRCGLALGTVNQTVKSCETQGYLANGQLTRQAIQALEPYKVANAVIMAAGLSSRFAPISYERPKGLLCVRGEVLIERQIEQLHQAGITNITLVVGYKKELFFYLREKYGVDIVVNIEYATRNNNGTLWRVRDRLSNTYICSSDNYFTSNPFESHVYEAYYACEKFDGPTNEWCITTGANNRIIDVTVGGQDSLIMLGHVYFDKTFSERFVHILEAEYDLDETVDKLWESIYIDHLDELSMVARPYEKGVINEFDSLDELHNFDQYFIENVDSKILDNIVTILHCKKSEIHGFWPLKKGLTNLSCHFSVTNADGTKEYVYRHPGIGTEKMINRESELNAMQLASKIGLDSTFIYADPQFGWKISRFVPNVHPLDINNDEQVKQAMSMCRKLHESKATLTYDFNFYDMGLFYEKLLLEHGPIEVPQYYELRNKIYRLNALLVEDGYPKVVSHNDFFALNFLVDAQHHMDLIDWEYAGMSDVANDFGTFVVCSQYDEAQGNKALDFYFDRHATSEEHRHFWGLVVMAGWCWYIWSLVKEAEGASVGEWLFIYYRYAVDYIDKVLGWYDQAETK